MLNFQKKLKIFLDILSQNRESYADSFNDDIYIISENYDYLFLEKLNSEEEIKNWINKLKSRIVMSEDDALLEDIVDDYIMCG
ncbi:hypothetical protein [Francisella sp. LA112445]|uniref:hypothetical protein n=1 Tax=Francisella sp. LA112445 TaxID=1395624 RepID=UPI001788B4B7|nr:hypothetical protein [Francisella sp. LA112445]QIW10580.1 hypothetical protein FIP56_07650 [Francisella sp. LA112445]